MHTVFALLCFVVVIHWLIFPYPSGLLHWHCGNLTIAPVPAKQPWWIWINTSCEFIMNDCITTTKQSTTKQCAYFLGYTVLTAGQHLFSNEPVNSNTFISICFLTICDALARMTPSLSWSVLLTSLSHLRGYPQMPDTLCCWTLYWQWGLAHFVKDAPLPFLYWYCYNKEHLFALNETGAAFWEPTAPKTGGLSEPSIASWIYETYSANAMPSVACCLLSTDMSKGLSLNLHLRAANIWTIYGRWYMESRTLMSPLLI